MKQTKIIMGMPITVEIVGDDHDDSITEVFSYFRAVDRRFSTYKATSEITKVNLGLAEDQWSAQMREVLELCEETKKLSAGYFDIRHNGRLDPSGLVKGWSIYKAALMLEQKQVKDFYIEAGGDIQVNGQNADLEAWSIGIRSPFNIHEIIKVVHLNNQGMATSGNYIRGQHIYDPLHPGQDLTALSSLTVIAKNVYEADRFATAAFAMGEGGINFLESKPGLEGYMVKADHIATLTSGFNRYLA